MEKEILGMFDWVDFAKDAYHAYGRTTDFKNFQGNPMPEWDALPERIQQAWIAAVKDVFRKLQVRDANGKRLVEEDSK